MGLGILFLLNQKISKLQTLLTIYRQMAEDVKVSKLREVRGTSQTSSVEWITALICDTEEKIAGALAEKEKAIREITLQLESANLPPDIYSIFFLRYVRCEQWKEIAHLVNYSRSYVLQLHKNWKGKFEE